MKSIHIRVSPDFKLLIYKIKAKEAAINAKEISTEDITQRLIKYIDWEKVWQNEYSKK